MADRERQLQYADRVSRVWIRRFRVSPVAGRVIGYLLVCDPEWQSIDELAVALHASRSAIAGAVKDLESYDVLQRRRMVGERVDRVRVTISQTQGFDPAPYRDAAAFAREGLTLLIDQSAERRRPLEEMASLNEFLAERLPQLLAEWREMRDASPTIVQELQPDQGSNEYRQNRTGHHPTTDGNLS
jgi:DNA-binding transcriptional regulator GbsR (MarR family)